jgi:hypothetical protein
LIARVSLSKQYVLIAEGISERFAALNNTCQLIEITGNVGQRRWAAVRCVLNRVSEMLYLNCVLQKLLGVFKVMHDLDAQLRWLGGAVCAHKNTAADLRPAGCRI